MHQIISSEAKRGRILLGKKELRGTKIKELLSRGRPGLRELSNGQESLTGVRQGAGSGRRPFGGTGVSIILY